MLFEYRKFHSRLTAREFNVKGNYETSNKAATAPDVPRGCRLKETIHTQPDQEEDYEVMNNYTIQEGGSIGGDNIYAVPDNIIATAMTQRGSGLGMREDMYDAYVMCDTVSTATTTCTAMQPGDGEGECGLELYEDLGNPEASSPGKEFKLH
jgi:hypothetical protein